VRKETKLQPRTKVQKARGLGGGKTGKSEKGGKRKALAKKKKCLLSNNDEEVGLFGFMTEQQRKEV